MARYVVFNCWFGAVSANIVLQDFPYAPRNTFDYEIEAINNATFLSGEEKAGVFAENSRDLFQ